MDYPFLLMHPEFRRDGLVKLEVFAVTQRPDFAIY